MERRNVRERKPTTARVREIKKCDLTHTCTRRYIGERRERRERRWALTQKEREGDRRSFNTPPQAGAWRSNMPSLDPMVSYAGPGRALVKMSAN